MPGMKIAEIRDMDSATLLEQVESKRQELFNLRIQWNTGSLEDPNQMRIVRKDIARILTVLRERELAAALLQSEPSQLPEPPEPSAPSVSTAESTAESAAAPEEPGEESNA
jgi:large subunit ribosomal protein L29